MSGRRRLSDRYQVTLDLRVWLSFLAGIQSRTLVFRHSVFTRKVSRPLPSFRSHARIEVNSCVIFPGNRVGTFRGGLSLYYGVEVQMPSQTITYILSYMHAHEVKLRLKVADACTTSTHLNFY